MVLRVQKISRGALTALWVLLIFAAATGVFGAAAASFLLGVRIGHTEGSSMEPLLRHGDVIVIRPIGRRRVRVGDVVLFQQGSRQTLHRVVREELEPNGLLLFVTRGDNAPGEDAPIMATAIEGRLVMKIPLLGAASRQLEGLGIGSGEFWNLTLALSLLGPALAALSWIQIRYSRSPRRVD